MPSTLSRLSLLLLGSLLGCSHEEHSPLDLAPEATSSAYGSVLAHARAVVPQAWGRPAQWDTLCGTVTTDTSIFLSLDPRLVSVTSTSRLAFAARLSPDSINAFIARDLVDRVCRPVRDDELCDDPTAGMNVTLSEPQIRGGDTIVIGFNMHRDHHCPRDNYGFAASLEFLLLPSVTGWAVVSYRLRMIT
jgi:hypothetical protein